MTAPASRSLRATAASRGTFAPRRAYEPAIGRSVLGHSAGRLGEPTSVIHLVLGGNVVLDKDWYAMQRPVSEVSR